MWRTFWAGATAVAVLLGLGVWASTQAVFLYRHPLAPDVRIVIDGRTGAAVVMAEAQREAPGVETPQAVTAETYFDFGVMDPLTMGRHDFVVRNAGRGELVLQPNGTTCKCTVGGVSDNRIPPGGQATVTLEWNTGRFNPHFRQSALVKTNDPLRKQLEFTVSGSVRTLIALDQEEFDFSGTSPDIQPRGEVLVYSQTWDNFQIAEASSALPGFHWTAAPATELPADLSATCAQRVTFSFSCDPDKRRFQDQVRFAVRQAGDPDAPPQHLYLSIRGSVASRFAIFGGAIDETGVVDLGHVPQGTGKRVRLLVKIRDEQPVIDKPRIEAFPAFLKVEFQPRPEERPGLYDLTIELPDNVAPCQFLSSPLGRIQIDTGHARVGVIELPVTFAVVPRRGL